MPYSLPIIRKAGLRFGGGIGALEATFCCELKEAPGYGAILSAMVYANSE